eukprot:s713_g11.t1
MGNAGACCASSTSTEKPEVAVATAPLEPTPEDPKSEQELKGAHATDPEPKRVVLRFVLPDGGAQDIEFENKPLGIDFSRSLPLTCKRLKPGMQGEQKEVKIGWCVTHINDTPVPVTFEETLKNLQQAVSPAVGLGPTLAAVAGPAKGELMSLLPGPGPASASGGPKRVFKRTQLCTFWVRGACKRGSACAFAHGEAQLRDSPDLSKTKICKKFQTGTCPLGEECTFAHCREELRSLRPKRHPHGPGTHGAGGAQQSAAAVPPSTSTSAFNSNFLVTVPKTRFSGKEDGTWEATEDSEACEAEPSYTVVEFESVEQVCGYLLEEDTPPGPRTQNLLFEL